MGSKSRGCSIEKWFILIPISTLWTASYHCMLCVAPLEHTMMKMYQLSNAEFSLFTTIIFAPAIVTSLATPYIIHKINLYNAMLLSCILCTIGQSIFTVSVLINNLLLMYVGRIFIGLCYGIQNVTIYTVLNIWFNHNKWLTLAINTVNTTSYIGSLTAYYCMIPLFTASGHIYVPYCLGIAFALISVIACIIMILIEKNFCNNMETHSASSKLDNNFSNIKNFKSMVWLILIIIAIGWSSSDTFATLLTVPLMIKFNMSEWSADIVLSANAIYSLTIGQIMGYIESQGYFSYYLTFSMIFMTVSYALLLGYNDTWLISGEIMAWIIMSFYVVGKQFFFGVCFTCLFLVCPLELTSVVNTVSSIGCMVGAMLQSYLFGIIADETVSYNASIFMVFGCLIFGSLIAVSVYFIDVIRDGRLHKKAIHSSENDAIIDQTIQSNNYGSLNTGKSSINVVE